MLREQPTADQDLAEVAETPSPACAQDNESDGEQPRSPRRPRARLPSRLLGGNDATRRGTAKGGKKAAKNSPHAASPTRLAGFSTLRRLRAARPATPHAPKTVNCWAAARGPYSRRSLVLKGHEGHVYALAALDGGRLASSSGDNFVIIWNLADGAQLAKLEGHTGSVYCLAALDGSRLASGSRDDSIIIWSLADGALLSKLEGHTNWVSCLAALDGDRLASGSFDKSIIIWNLADGTQLAKLEGHTSVVSSLATLDGGRLASGSGDKSIIIWNVADSEQLAQLEGHTDSVWCLAALDGDRLASGSDDKSVIIWNLADGEQLAPLEGHRCGVYCLAALDGDRLASGSSDHSIIIWNLADGAQIARLESHTNNVNCLAELADGRLASGSNDLTIRVRPLANLAVLAACGSAFEFEEVARAHRDQKCLGDLFDAAVVQSDERIGGSDAAITRQAHAFDAIAKVITSEDDTTALVERLLDFVRDHDLLPDMKRESVSDAAIEKLAPSPLFRVVIDAKYVAGPRLLLYVEFLSFLVVMLCFARVATFDVLDFSAPLLLATRAVEKTVALCVAFAVLAYFSARELYQMKAARAIELAQPENPLWSKNRYGKFESWKVDGLARYAMLILRLVVLFVAWLPLLPVLLAVFGLRCADKEYEWMDAFENWFEANIVKPIRHDPLTFLGLPRAWRRDYWNFIDAVTIGCAWAAFVRAATPGTRLRTDLAAATAVLLWLELFGFLKNINQSLATLVLMIERIVDDIWVFLFFYFIWVLLFGSVFYLRLGTRHADTFGFHKIGAPNAFESVRMTIFSLLLFSFTGDVDPDNFPTHVDKALLVVYLLVTVVVQLNILIAIVGDSYDAARATGKALYYRAHLELVTETSWIANRLLPRRLLPTVDDRWIKERLAVALREQGDDDRGRIVDITRRTRAAVQADTQRAIADLEERMVERMDAKLDEVLQLLRARENSTWLF